MLLALSLLAAAPAAPVPKPKPSDPLAYAYIGVRVNTSQMQNPRLRIDPPELGTPAAAAGLREGDEITRIGTMEIRSFNDLADYVLDLRPGTRVVVEFWRNGERKSVWLTLGVRPSPPDYPNPDFTRKTRGGPKPIGDE
jgi:S1-C subfamily serine protease